MSKRLHVKYPLFLSDFKETYIVSTDFRKKTLKYQVSSKSVKWEPICSCRRTETLKVWQEAAVVVKTACKVRVHIQQLEATQYNR
jgi:hypothetical protein